LIPAINGGFLLHQRSCHIVPVPSRGAALNKQKKNKKNGRGRGGKVAKDSQNRNQRVPFTNVFSTCNNSAILDFSHSSFFPVGSI
jgi:hypothetical protein